MNTVSPMLNTVILQYGRSWRKFQNPLRVVTAVSPQEVLPALVELETAIERDKLYAAGFISYEAAAAFDLAVHPPQEGLPLLWFGLFEGFEEIGDWRRETHSPLATRHSLIWQPTINRTTYNAAIQQIKAQIAAANSYQVNYTFPQNTVFSGDPLAYFAELVAAQQANYAAFVEIGRFAICSASPELFFKLDGSRLEAKPMKGTAVRGRTLAEDKANIAWLSQSEKNRAENVMIVDMIRNDMGRVAQVGSVSVPKLFEVERYPTVLQMTSTVTAKTDAPLSQIFASMFPCASITGAPKVRTMEIIKTLEPQPRGVYTGSIGFIGPNRQAQFNVAIRTVLVGKAQGQATYGVGGGIVWDSVAAEEYEECRIKSRVLTEKRPSFQLIETMLWQPDGGIFLLEEHLARLHDSAEYFGIGWEETAVRAELKKVSQPLNKPSKIRLLLGQDGRFTLKTTPLDTPPNPQPKRIGLAKEPVDSSSVWLYHKTTRRQIYDTARASRPDCDEVILHNERGELTEATIANIALLLDGELVTPPIKSGLLGGTFRGYLLANQGLHNPKGFKNPWGLPLREKVLTLADLDRCEAIYLMNSVRGWIISMKK
ncbi:Para-aminobenzoate synthase, aminase component / Aminodeoxychorismate lyase [hydrothermal vent metagenome]|uniref:Para-aminobenzoate synthase, aminase component / Aminodeoxychorismate lyase n=1 Tax=hydrothermal vent metagenome TaxID=652676 RepID=A0A3B0VWJ8_9ZZZZ